MYLTYIYIYSIYTFRILDHLSFWSLSFEESFSLTFAEFQSHDCEIAALSQGCSLRTERAILSLSGICLSLFYLVDMFTVKNISLKMSHILVICCSCLHCISTLYCKYEVFFVGKRIFLECGGIATRGRTSDCLWNVSIQFDWLFWIHTNVFVCVHVCVRACARSSGEANMAAIYYENIDVQGHHWGPDSQQVRTAVLQLDGAMQMLTSKIKVSLSNGLLFLWWLSKFHISAQKAIC